MTPTAITVTRNRVSRGICMDSVRTEGSLTTGGGAPGGDALVGGVTGGDALGGGAAGGGTAGGDAMGGDAVGVGSTGGDAAGRDVAGGASLNCVRSSAIVGRRLGSRSKHPCTASTNSGARSGGRGTASELSRDHAGAVCVRASTRVMPSPHMSPAVDTPPFLVSGGSYTEVLAVLAARSPTGRIVSLASFNRSSMTRKLVGLSPPCTKFWPWR